MTSEKISSQLKEKLRQTLERDSGQPLPRPHGPETVFERLSRSYTDAKKDLDDTLTWRQSGDGPGTDADEAYGLSAIPPDEIPDTGTDRQVEHQPDHEKGVTFLKQTISGGSMQDLSGYKDLSKPPVVSEDEDDENEKFGPAAVTGTLSAPVKGLDKPPVFSSDYADAQPGGDTEFSSNVRTLIRLVNDLPEGVTKQTGAQIIRLTMEAMGISMEDVLTEAQSAQSEMLDAVRANIKKIEEYKTVIRKLESDIKYYQGKANELSEIIDLFILSNTSPKVPNVDELTEG